MPRRLSLILSLASLALLLGGCQTYTAKSEGQIAALRAHDYARAAALADQAAAKNRDNRDALLYRLEQGATLRAAALAAPTEAPEPPDAYLRRSLDAFETADTLVERFDAGPKVRLGSEGAALLTNQANTPYTGRAYDRIMLNTYKALDRLQLGDTQAARVELNRALARQREAVEANADRIGESLQQTDADVRRARTDPTSGAALDRISAAADARILAYGDYVNPFTVYLDGLYFLHAGLDNSDLERARKSLQRVAGLHPANPDLQADLADAGQGRRSSGLTYIIHETGFAPHREEVRIDLPALLVTDRISYIGAAFPELAYDYGYVPALDITAGGRTARTRVICDMDSVVSQDFKNEWPSILARTLASTVTKAVADATVQNQARKELNATGQLLALLATTITQYAVNTADTRSWRTLPKEFQSLRIDTPADRQLTVSAGGRTRTITVEPGEVNIVYIKTTDSAGPLLVSQFKLR